MDRQLRFSWTTPEPYVWDHPFISHVGGDEYQARRGDNVPLARGDLEAMLALVVAALPPERPIVDDHRDGAAAASARAASSAAAARGVIEHGDPSARTV